MNRIKSGPHAAMCSLFVVTTFIHSGQMTLICSTNYSIQLQLRLETFFW